VLSFEVDTRERVDELARPDHQHGHGAWQLPWTHDPEQHCEVSVHAPPSGAQLVPVALQIPPWQAAPVQQSASVVHVPLSVGTHAALQANPVDDPGTGRHRCEQHWSPKLHSPPLATHALEGLHRATPIAVALQDALPPLQQFCDEPRPPHTSPSARQLSLPHRRSPYASTAAHFAEQQSRSFVQISLYARQPPMA
jgi:hypothetical protein